MEARNRVYTALGLMTGTSVDGIDAAIVRTDGDRMVERGHWSGAPFPDGLEDRLRAALGATAPTPQIAALETDFTRAHAPVVAALIEAAGLSAGDIDVIGFHGQTLWHDPANRRTWQIGDGALLARLTGIPVVNEFRLADVAAGGQGAPFAPLYHDALATGLPRPLAVLNLGGVGNVTLLRADEPPLAFDTGPANAMLDDWMAARTGASCDRDGKAGAAGTVDRDLVARWCADPYFRLPAPKSLDRNAFAVPGLGSLSTEDGAATLTAFTVASVALARDLLPEAPARWLVTGGGRHNLTMMAMLREALGAPVDPVEAVGWDGDAIEAQAFAYLAVRSLKGLPLSVPSTTGVPAATTGGRVHTPAGSASGGGAYASSVSR